MVFCSCCVLRGGAEIVCQDNLALSTDKVTWPLQRADVSSVRPSSERIEELGLCVVYIHNNGATLLVGACKLKKRNKSVE